MSKPQPPQSMLRGAATNLLTWRLSTLAWGSGGSIQTLPLKCPNSFFQDCLRKLPTGWIELHVYSYNFHIDIAISMKVGMHKANIT